MFCFNVTFRTPSQNLCKILAKEIIFSKAAGLSYDKISICIKIENLYRIFFHLLNPRQILNRTHFDGYFSSASLELQAIMELKLLPCFLS